MRYWLLYYSVKIKRKGYISLLIFFLVNCRKKVDAFFSFFINVKIAYLPKVTHILSQQILLEEISIKEKVFVDTQFPSVHSFTWIICFFGNKSIHREFFAWLLVSWDVRENSYLLNKTSHITYFSSFSIFFSEMNETLIYM